MTRKNDGRLGYWEWRHSCLGEMVMNTTCKHLQPKALELCSNMIMPSVSMGNAFLRVLICSLSYLLCFTIIIFPIIIALKSIEPGTFCEDFWQLVQASYFFDSLSFTFSKTLPHFISIFKDWSKDCSQILHMPFFKICNIWN